MEVVFDFAENQSLIHEKAITAGKPAVPPWTGGNPSFLMIPWGHRRPGCVNVSANISDMTLSTWDDWKQSFYITVEVVLIKAEAELDVVQPHC